MLDELLVLVRGERRAHRGHEEPVELVASEPIMRRLLQVRERTGAELGIRLGLEVLVGEQPVLAQLLFI